MHKEAWPWWTRAGWAATVSRLEMAGMAPSEGDIVGGLPRVAWSG